MHCIESGNVAAAYGVKLARVQVIAGVFLCLALVAIGTTEALEVVGNILLPSDEDLRRAAAEALGPGQRPGPARRGAARAGSRPPRKGNPGVKPTK